MLNKFQKCLVEDYDKNSAWCYIINILNKNEKSSKNTVILLFKWGSNNIIWY